MEAADLNDAADVEDVDLDLEFVFLPRPFPLPAFAGLLLFFREECESWSFFFGALSRPRERG